VSDHIAGIVGHTAEDFVAGRIGPHDVIHADDMEMLERTMTEAIEAGRQFSLEYRMIHADGSFRWVAENGRVLRDEATGKRWLDGALIDVTERKQADEELRRLALIVESSGDAIFGLTLEGRVTSWNSAAEAATGYTAEEMAGRHISRVLPEDRHGDLVVLRDRLLGGERITGFETRLVKRSGETADIALSVALISGEAGLAVTVRDITAAKEAERKLRESEQRTRMLFDTALDAVVSMDESGRITSWNAQAEAIFGWKREEAIGRKLADTIVPAAFREAHQRGLARFLTTGETKVLGSRIEITALARDGREFPVELAIVPIEHEGRYEFSAFLRDISARKDAEERLREAEERYRILVEQLPMITYVDVPGETPEELWLPQYVSPQLESMLGWSPEEWMSDPNFYFDRIVHPDDQAYVNEAHEVAFSNLTGHTIEHRLMHRDGSVRWFADHMVIARDDDGRPFGSQGYLLDITERKEAEDRLREAETRYAAIVESSDDAIFGLSLDGVVTSWNAGAERLYGYSAEEMVGKDAAVVIPPELRDRERQAIKGMLRSGRNVRLLETERLRKDGSLVPVSVSISPMRDAEGTWLGAAGIARDITEQKAAKAELERLLERERAQVAELRTLDTMKDEFIALVSHELRTPLTSIRGYLELVSEGTGELSAEQEHFLGVVSRNAERLQNLVGDLLFVAQIEAGRLQLETAPVGLEQIAAEAVESARPLADQKQIELSLETESLPLLEGDRGRLGQLLDNFLSNAIKFTPEGGNVYVRLRKHQDSALLEVEDTGMGIPQAEQERLFERFFRTSNATAQAIQGTGLGLTISKAIAEAHGGRISFTSAENEGTTFRIELPLAANMAVAA
jgi:PAS domain S-box-containing protein